MDILIRILIMIIISVGLPFLTSIIYEPIGNFKELDKIEQILWILFYAFILNWFVIVPSAVFMECLKYIVQ